MSDTNLNLVMVYIDRGYGRTYIFNTLRWYSQLYLILHMCKTDCLCSLIAIKWNKMNSRIYMTTKSIIFFSNGQNKRNITSMVHCVHFVCMYWQPSSGNFSTFISMARFVWWIAYFSNTCPLSSQLMVSTNTLYAYACLCSTLLHVILWYSRPSKKQQFIYWHPGLGGNNETQPVFYIICIYFIHNLVPRW